LENFLKMSNSDCKIVLIQIRSLLVAPFRSKCLWAYWATPLPFLWVLNFQEIQRCPWDLSPFWRFWKFNGATYIWALWMELIYFNYLDMNFGRITSQVNSLTIRIRMPAGNLIGGFGHSQIQNSKNATNYQTKLRILIIYEKKEVLGWSFPPGGVHEWRQNEIKSMVAKISEFIFDLHYLWTPPTWKLHPWFSFLS
jgi:hypothetical protein